MKKLFFLTLFPLALSASALEKAVLDDNIQGVQSILATPEGQSSLNLADHSGDTPLSLAAFNGNKGIVNALLNAKANVTPKVFDQALQKPLIMKLLLDKGANPNVVISSGQTPLTFSARLGDEDILKALLNAPQTDLFMPNKSGQTALDMAKGKKANMIREAIAKRLYALRRTEPSTQYFKDDLQALVSYFIDHNKSAHTTYQISGTLNLS